MYLFHWINACLVIVLLLAAAAVHNSSAEIGGLLTTSNQDGIDCDDMVVYYKQLAKHFAAQCGSGKSSGSECPENLQVAVNWFNRAHDQIARSCYYDVYEDY